MAGLLARATALRMLPRFMLVLAAMPLMALMWLTMPATMRIHGADDLVVLMMVLFKMQMNEVG